MSEKDRTIWCGNLGREVSDEILYELFLQAGPLERVHRPKDKSGEPRSYAFIQYEDVESAPYALQLLRDTELYGRPVRLQYQGAGEAPAGDRNGGRQPAEPRMNGHAGPGRHLMHNRSNSYPQQPPPPPPRHPYRHQPPWQQPPPPPRGGRDEAVMQQMVAQQLFMLQQHQQHQQQRFQNPRYGGPPPQRNFYR